jgi:uncharacterized DUF497 family protein
MRFSWDLNKDWSNRRKHRVAFQDAIAVFNSSLIRYAVADIENGELRLAATGPSLVGLLRVTYVERTNVVRIISARKVSRQERRSYERGE